MALPPTASAMPTESMPPAGGAPDMPMEGEGSEWMPVATVLKNSEGMFKVISGDEPEDGSEPDGETYDSGPAALRAVMGLLDGGNEAAAESSFGKGFKGEPDDMAAEGPPMAG